MQNVIQNATVTTDDGMQGKFLFFSIGDVQYGVGIEYVTEIIRVQHITPVPNTPPYVKGIANVRGTIVPVIDLRAKFNMDEVPYTDRTCIILLKLNALSLGLIVDAVQDVIELAPGDIQAPPRGRNLKGVGKAGNEVKQIIDIEKIFEIE